MNGYTKFLFLALVLAFFVNCKSGVRPSSDGGYRPASANTTAAPKAAPIENLDDIKNIVFKLIEVKEEYGTITVDRDLLSQKSFGDYFTLQFADEGVNGKACPNRYFSPYAMIDGQNIALKPMVSTYIASNFNLFGGAMSEKKYYNLLQNLDSWKYVTGILQIYSVDENGSEVTLVFSAE
jgi:hypothetical protein